MPELLPGPPNLVTTEAPTPGVSPQQVAQPFRELAETFAKTGEASENLAETQAKYEGLQAGANATVNADGTVQIPKAPIIGQASQEYERAVKMGVLAKGEGQVKDATRKLMLDHADDPEGYRQATDAFRDKTLADYSKIGAPDIGIALAKALDSSSVFTYRMLVNQKRNLELRSSWQNVQDGRNSAANDLQALYRSGAGENPNDPRVIQAWDKYNTLTAQAVKNPAFGYPAEKAQFDTNQLRAETQGSDFLHHIDQIYGDQSAGADGRPKGGAAAALTAAQSILTDPNANLSPAQRQQFYAKAVAGVRANEAIRRQDLGVARGAVQAVNEASALGARVDPETVNNAYNGLIKAGDPAGAARFAAVMARKPLNDDFGRQPLGDQLDQLRSLQSGGNPTSPAEARLIGYESGGNPQSVNRFGYAGLYQFGAPLLSDLGMYKPGPGESMADWSKTPASAPGKWSGTFAIPGHPEVKTLRDFLGNPAAQKAAFDAHTTSMDAAIKANGMDKYIGQTVGGVPITQDGLRAMIHLGGAENTLRALQSGGAAVTRDANGTSLLDYARLGAEGQHGTPSANMWLAGNRAREIGGEARTAWKTITDDYEKTGIRPANAVLGQLVDAARLTNDSDLLDSIGAGIDRMDLVHRGAQEPLPQQASDIGALRQAGDAGLLQPGQSAVLKDLERKNAAIIKGLADNPVATTVQNFSDRFNMPAPLDLKNPDNFAAGLAQRARIAQFARQNWQTGPVSALDAADLAQVRGALATPDPAAKAQIFQGLATLPEDVRGATLKKLGGNDLTSLAEASAGTLMPANRDLAMSIFRGFAALGDDNGKEKGAATTRQFDANVQDKQSFGRDLATGFPNTVFSHISRENPTGDYATTSLMIRARYADLSAQDDANGTHYSQKRLDRAIDDVTGGIVHQNDAPLIAPQRGMDQAHFDGVMAGVTDKDLDGVTTLNGAPISASYLRSRARLESVGSGRYLVNLGLPGKQPIYAFQYANTERPNPFVLDLRGRQPTQPATPYAGVLGDPVQR
jgi:hypothetical protein